MSWYTQLAKSTFLLVIISLFWVACQNTSVTTKPDSTSEKASWSARMHELSSNLSQLIPFIASRENFENPENKKVILAEIQKLRNLAHKLSTQSLPDQDPSLSFIRHEFEKDIERSVEAFNLGHKDYARFTLRNSISYCIQCHTRTSLGPSLNMESLSKSLNPLPAFERGEFYLATRDFNRAKEEFTKILKDPSIRVSRPFDLDKAARALLTLEVRYENNPAEALQTTELLLQRTDLPQYLKEDAQAWKKAILAWQREPSSKITNPQKQLELAKKLIRKSSMSSQFYNETQNDVELLRASYLLHECLSKNLSAQQKAEALYLQGIAYEGLKHISSWDRGEKYYEACIHSLPHSSWAKKCYKRFEQSTYFGFSGSGGMLLPPETQHKLVELKELSK